MQERWNCMRDQERLIEAPQKRDRGNGSKELVNKVGMKLSDITPSIKPAQYALYHMAKQALSPAKRQDSVGMAKVIGQQKWNQLVSEGQQYTVADYLGLLHACVPDTLIAPLWGTFVLSAIRLYMSRVKNGVRVLDRWE